VKRLAATSVVAEALAGEGHETRVVARGARHLDEAGAHVSAREEARGLLPDAPGQQRGVRRPPAPEGLVQRGCFRRPARRIAGPNKESLGTMKLYVNDKVVAEGPMKTQPAKFTLSGDGLCVGFDSGDAVSAEYTTPGTFHGGTIQGVAITGEKAAYIDLEQEAQRAVMRDESLPASPIHQKL
jgi:hypothetical protein